MDLVAVLHIGDFVTNLAYRQTEVPAYTDSTLVVRPCLASRSRAFADHATEQMLLPVLALPIVQRVVDGAFLTVDTAMISNPSDTCESFALSAPVRALTPRR